MGFTKTARTLLSTLRPADNPVRKEMAPYSLADQRRHDDEFAEWRKRNPTKTYKEFTAEQMNKMVDGEVLHPSIGANLRDGRYEESGADFFKKLKKYGLKRDDICVEYGCGTLRIGQHVIRYLGRRCYWGLDITPALLEKGRMLIGASLVAEKEPELRLISGSAVAEATAAKPAMVFSHRVLPHVHPDDLPEYFKNLMTLIGRTGQAIVNGKWNDGGIVPYKHGSWAHSESTLRALVSNLGGRIMVIHETEETLPTEPPRDVKRGVFRVLHESNARAFA